MMDTTVGVCASCGDSPLSIASNIIGIITFVVASTATYFAYLILTLGALEEISALEKELRGTSAQLVPLIEFCQTEDAEGRPQIKLCKTLLLASIRTVQEGAETALKEITALPQYNIRSRNPFDFQSRRRFLWVQKRQSIVEKVARISEKKIEILALQTSILLWKTRADMVIHPHRGSNS